MTSDAMPLEGLRLLLAEDEALIAIDLEAMLQQLGCEVVGPFPSLRQVAKAAETEQLDGAILDVNLRGEASTFFPSCRSCGRETCRWCSPPATTTRISCLRSFATCR
jgi:DNA-binding NarL/FixJ family response regulator